MTLLEVMVAMALLAIIGVMASKGLTQIIRARDVVYDEQARWRGIAMAWARVGEDVTTAVDGLPMDMTEIRWVGQEATAQWAIWGSGGTVLPVQYSLRNGTLLRTQGTDLSRPQKTMPGTGGAVANKPDLEMPLLRDVRVMVLSFLDGRGSWHDQWPQQGVPYSRPRALRMSLVLGNGREIVRIFALP